MPYWIEIAQEMDFNFVTERYLKSGLVYQEFYDGNNFFWDGGSLRFEAQNVHDPLVTIATFFNGKPRLPESIRLKVLDYAYDARHQSTERFWSGLNLQTSDIVTNVQFFPEYRLAYSELILRVRNEQYKRRSRWFDQEEAIYTFQIPEESVVSSLSLWIEGKEAKARLTTKSKAEEAYNTIVGREMRDPSVVYWMEGNKIRVRIFPCTPEEERQFKIGVTSPLRIENENLLYESITFKGPDFSKARASINILGDGMLPSIKASSLSFEEDKGLLSWEGRYKPHWTVSLTAIPLTGKPFTFNGKSYRIESLTSNVKPFQATSVFIDLNKQWSDDELEDVFNIVKGKNVYALASGSHIKKISTSSDLQNLYKPNFSLFPFHKVKDPGNALVITKGDILTPNLSDLSGSTFKEHLFHSFTGTNEKIKVFDLSTQPSSYIKSLDEFQILDYHAGTLAELGQVVKNENFPVYNEEEGIVSISSAQIQIRSENDGQTDSLAPDHLLRLFAYNKVMQGIGRNYFKNDFLEEELITTASTANIVTPISSLIVLETLNDYERFGIDENKDSLGNASVKSSGSSTRTSRMGDHYNPDTISGFCVVQKGKPGISEMIEVVKINSIYLRVTLLCLLAIGLFIMVNPGYLIIDLFMVVGILSLPATFKIQKNARSLRFFWPAIAITLLSLILKSTFGAYCSLIFFMLLAVEMYIGKLSLLTLFHLLLLSPLFKYFTSLISFPLRMQIAKITAGMFQLAGMDIELSGNLIMFSDTEFLVDKACMGLHMLGYSILFGLIILGLTEKKSYKLSFRSITIFMILLLALNFLSNLCRASVLILFKIMPESWLHDIVGLLAFTLYVLLPFYLISRWWNKHRKDHISSPAAGFSRTTIRFSMVVALYVLSVWQSRATSTSTENEPFVNLAGFSQTELENHVVKLSNQEALIYIKPPVAPYKADHNPLICWQGSGYSFKKINYMHIGGHKVHFAELVKGEDKLYSAWWFQSIDTITSDQWQWRWDAIAKNQQYSMVNVTCATVEVLESNCLNFIQSTSQLKPILTKTELNL